MYIITSFGIGIINFDPVFTQLFFLMAHTVTAVYLCSSSNCYSQLINLFMRYLKFQKDFESVVSKVAVPNEQWDYWYIKYIHIEIQDSNIPKVYNIYMGHININPLPHTLPLIMRYSRLFNQECFVGNSKHLESM